MATDLLLVIDEGTTSTRAMLFEPGGACTAVEQKEVASRHPEPGWVEQDAEEIWSSSLACARAVVERSGGPDGIAAIGIANQRETIVFWSRRTGAALAPAIVWQDRRTAALCDAKREAGHEAMVQRRTYTQETLRCAAGRRGRGADRLSGPAARCRDHRPAPTTARAALERREELESR